MRQLSHRITALATTTSLLAGVFAPPALAQDGGAYFGLEAGYENLDDRIDGVRLNADGLLARGFGGYDWTREDGLFWGVEGGLLWSDASGSSPISVPEFNIRTKSNWGIDVLGRVGSVTPGGGKLFLTGGYVYRRTAVKRFNLIDPDDTSSFSDWGDAFQWGAGAEFPLDPQTSIRARVVTYDDEFFDQFQILGGVAFKF